MTKLIVPNWVWIQPIRDWLHAEVAKAKIARAKIQSGQYRDGQQLFLLERAQKAEATARVLRKAIKMGEVK